MHMLSIWSGQTILSFGKELTHYQTTNFKLFQTERLCRRQFKIWRKWKKVMQTGRKHCGKRRNRSLRAISPFPTVFSKGLFPWGVKRCRCLGKSLSLSWPITDWITDSVMLYAFNIISIISRLHLILFMTLLGFASTRPGPWSVLPKDIPTKWLNSLNSFHGRRVLRQDRAQRAFWSFIHTICYPLALFE